MLTDILKAFVSESFQESFYEKIKTRNLYFDFFFLNFLLKWCQNFFKIMN